MNRTLRYALGVVLGAAVAMPAMAQDNFPDVPENHWAYEALANMKRDGLLVGYPDGLYRGGRPASRYELAVAIHATYQKLKGMYDGLSGQIDSLSSALDGKADKADLQSLRDALDALKADLDGMKAWGDDIEALKKLTSTFEKELASMGVDVEAMKKDIGDLQDRVEKLEKRKPAVDIHGTVDLMTINGYGDDDNYGLTVDGRFTGVGRGAYAYDVVPMTRDFSVLHEGALTLTGTNDEGPTWKATLVTGNMIGDNALGNQSELGYGGFMESEQSVYLQEFLVKFDTSLAGQGFSAEVGRIGYQISDYILKRPDTTPYFANERWDNGNWMFDGAKLGFGMGGGKLNVFGGRLIGDVAGVDSALQPMYLGGPPVDDDYYPAGRQPMENGVYKMDQIMGLHLNLPFGETVTANLAYLWMTSNAEGYDYVPPVDRFEVWGGDLKINLNPITLSAGYAASIVRINDNTVNDENNTAWYAKLGYATDNWGISGGYREIENRFDAPGDWGRVGTFWNPVGHKGFMADLWFNLGDNLKLTVAGEMYEGIDDYEGLLSTEDEVKRLVGELHYKLNPDWTLRLGGEYVKLNFEYGDEYKQQWYHVGLDYAMGNQAKLGILWQISDADFDAYDSSEYKGGMLVTQLSVKF